MIVIESYIDINKEDRVLHKIYGTYDSKELAIKTLDELINHFQNNYADNILRVMIFDDGISLKIKYIEPGNEDFEQVAILNYVVTEISTPDSILNTTPNGIGDFIYKIMFQDND